jgi:hypothetical protein
MQIVYVMEVIDPLERPNGASYVRRFMNETRASVGEVQRAIRFGFQAYVDRAGRMRVTTQTTAHEHLRIVGDGLARAARQRRPRTTPQRPSPDPGRRRLRPRGIGEPVALTADPITTVVRDRAGVP